MEPSAVATFRELDTNHDGDFLRPGRFCSLLLVAGALSYEELWNKLSDSGLADTHIEQLFFRLDANHDGKVSLDEFKAALTRMRETLKGQDGAAKEYTSFNKMAHDRFKHIRMDKNLETKYKVPLTFN